MAVRITMMMMMMMMMVRIVRGGVACSGSPCNNGVCVDSLTLNSTYECFCVDGWTGMHCQTNWDECWSQPCLNGGTCVDLVAALTCICPPGFTGEYCEREVDECASNPCQNNGTCMDLRNRYVCSCMPGYTGVNCEVDVSVCNSTIAWLGSAPRCLNKGVCVDGPGLDFSCLCQPGWRGRRCETDENECLTTPCFNSAICINTPGSFACACQFGFTGMLCESSVVFCESSPCENGALCIMEEDNATCYCVPDYHGSHCQDQYNDCEPYAPRCMNGGVCIDGVDSYMCLCPPTTTGELCQCIISSRGGKVCRPLPYWFTNKTFVPLTEITVTDPTPSYFPPTDITSDFPPTPDFPPDVTDFPPTELPVPPIPPSSTDIPPISPSFIPPTDLPPTDLPPKPPISRSPTIIPPTEVPVPPKPPISPSPTILPPISPPVTILPPTDVPSISLSPTDEIFTVDTPTFDVFPSDSVTPSVDTAPTTPFISAKIPTAMTTITAVPYPTSEILEPTITAILSDFLTIQPTPVLPTPPSSPFLTSEEIYTTPVFTPEIFITPTIVTPMVTPETISPTRVPEIVSTETLSVAASATFVPSSSLQPTAITTPGLIVATSDLPETDTAGLEILASVSSTPAILPSSSAIETDLGYTGEPQMPTSTTKITTYISDTSDLQTPTDRPTTETTMLKDTTETTTLINTTETTTPKDTTETTTLIDTTETTIPKDTTKFATSVSSITPIDTTETTMLTDTTETTTLINTTETTTPKDTTETTTPKDTTETPTPEYTGTTETTTPIDTTETTTTKDITETTTPKDTTETTTPKDITETITTKDTTETTTPKNTTETTTPKDTTETTTPKDTTETTTPKDTTETTTPKDTTESTTPKDTTEITAIISGTTQVTSLSDIALENITTGPSTTLETLTYQPSSPETTTLTIYTSPPTQDYENVTDTSRPFELETAGIFDGVTTEAAITPKIADPFEDKSIDTTTGEYQSFSATTENYQSTTTEDYQNTITEDYQRTTTEEDQRFTTPYREPEWPTDTAATSPSYTSETVEYVTPSTPVDEELMEETSMSTPLSPSSTPLPSTLVSTSVPTVSASTTSSYTGTSETTEFVTQVDDQTTEEIIETSTLSPFSTPLPSSTPTVLTSTAPSYTTETTEYTTTDDQMMEETKISTPLPPSSTLPSIPLSTSTPSVSTPESTPSLPVTDPTYTPTTLTDTTDFTDFTTDSKYPSTDSTYSTELPDSITATTSYEISVTQNTSAETSFPETSTEIVSEEDTTTPTSSMTDSTIFPTTTATDIYDVSESTTTDTDFYDASESTSTTDSGDIFESTTTATDSYEISESTRTATNFYVSESTTTATNSYDLSEITSTDSYEVSEGTTTTTDIYDVSESTTTVTDNYDVSEISTDSYNVSESTTGATDFYDVSESTTKPVTMITDDFTREVVENLTTTVNDEISEITTIATTTTNYSYEVPQNTTNTYENTTDTTDIYEIFENTTTTPTTISSDDELLPKTSVAAAVASTASATTASTATAVEFASASPSPYSSPLSSLTTGPPPTTFQVPTEVVLTPSASVLLPEYETTELPDLTPTFTTPPTLTTASIPTEIPLTPTEIPITPTELPLTPTPTETPILTPAPPTDFYTATTIISPTDIYTPTELTPAPTYIPMTPSPPTKILDTFTDTFTPTDTIPTLYPDTLTTPMLIPTTPIPPTFITTTAPALTTDPTTTTPTTITSPTRTLPPTTISPTISPTITISPTSPVTPIPPTPSITPPTPSITPPTPPEVSPTPEPPQRDGPTECGDRECFNGGTCLDLNGTYLCLCPFNYRGESCQQYFYVNKPLFSGASYLGLRVGILSLRQGVQIYIQFTSQDANGLVLYSEGPGKTYFMLLLRNSVLQFAFSCGLQTVAILQGNEKLDRDCRTDVSLRMWWTPYYPEVPWGPGMCSASMQVNGTAPVYSEQHAWSPQVRLGVLYLGGLPRNYSFPFVVKAGLRPRLKGCVSNLEVNGREVDMWKSGVSGEGVGECGTAPCPPRSCLNGGSCVPGPSIWSCLCPPGYQGELCEVSACEGGGRGPCQSGRCVLATHHPYPLCLCPAHRHGLFCELERMVERPLYSGSVEGYTSHSVYRMEPHVMHSLAISLHFTTGSLGQVSLLAYLGNSVRATTRDFFALSLVRGYLMLTWDLGAGPRRVITSQPLDPRLHTHTVRAGRVGRVGWLMADTQTNSSARSPGFLSSLNTNNLLYVGGHPSWNMSHLPADIWRLGGFRGCVFDLRVAPTNAGPWTAVRVAAATNVGECGYDVCGRPQNKDGHLASSSQQMVSPSLKMVSLNKTFSPSHEHSTSSHNERLETSTTTNFDDFSSPTPSFHDSNPSTTTYYGSSSPTTPYPEFSSSTKSYSDSPSTTSYSDSPSTTASLYDSPPPITSYPDSPPPTSYPDFSSPSTIDHDSYYITTSSHLSPSTQQSFESLLYENVNRRKKSTKRHQGESSLGKQLDRHGGELDSDGQSDSVPYRQYESQSTKPLCNNGGWCVSLGATYRCECSVGWKGPKCDVPSHVCSSEGKRGEDMKEEVEKSEGEKIDGELKQGRENNGGMLEGLMENTKEERQINAKLEEGGEEDEKMLKEIREILRMERLEKEMQRKEKDMEKDRVDSEIIEREDNDTEKMVNNKERDGVNSETESSVNNVTKERVESEVIDSINNKTQNRVNNETEDRINDEITDRINNYTERWQREKLFGDTASLMVERKVVAKERISPVEHNRNKTTDERRGKAQVEERKEDEKAAMEKMKREDRKDETFDGSKGRQLESLSVGAGGGDVNYPNCPPGSSCLLGGSGSKDATCVCPLGRTGPRCDTALNITDPSFSGKGSYLVLQPTRSLRREVNLTLSFRPVKADGILVLSVPPRPRIIGDWLALLLVNSTLVLSFHLGWPSPSPVVVMSVSQVKLGVWQEVQIWREEGLGGIDFHGHTTKAYSEDDDWLWLDVGPELYIGGAPDPSMVPPLAGPPHTLVPFTGCVSKVLINGVDHDLRVPVEGGSLVGGAGVADCDDTPCGLHLCLHGGTCIPVGDSFVCTCTQDYTGSRCHIPLACQSHKCQNEGICIPSSPAKRHRRQANQGTGTSRLKEGRTKQDTNRERDEEDGGRLGGKQKQAGNRRLKGDRDMHEEKRQNGRQNENKEGRVRLEEGRLDEVERQEREAMKSEEDWLKWRQWLEEQEEEKNVIEKVLRKEERRREEEGRKEDGRIEEEEEKEGRKEEDGRIEERKKENEKGRKEDGRIEKEREIGEENVERRMMKKEEKVEIALVEEKEGMRDEGEEEGEAIEKGEIEEKNKEKEEKGGFMYEEERLMKEKEEKEEEIDNNWEEETQKRLMDREKNEEILLDEESEYKLGREERSEKGYTCVCPQGFYGMRCQTRSGNGRWSVDGVRFSGRSWAVVGGGRYGTPSSTQDSIAFNFTTTKPDGLLIWRGKVEDAGSDFLGVGVVTEKVRVAWHLGGGTVSHITIPERVSDGTWHSLAVWRRGAMVTAVLDGRHPHTNTPYTTFTQLNDGTGLLYIGGFRGDVGVRYGTGGQFESAFVGCLRDLTLHRAPTPIPLPALTQSADLHPCTDGG